MARRQALQFGIKKLNQLASGATVPCSKSGHQLRNCIRRRIEHHHIILFKKILKS
jgi:hypothetical protein